MTELPYSSKRKQTVQEGHSLDIPMVARIMQAQQGQLILTNNENQKGLQVVMELPLHSLV
ncbi:MULTISPECIES: hypothetical protein [Bacillus cereus group]|uniref:hypothetical protein n=1 Tax=Bacillus cereus group TaxID=86661 RepID=UPI0037BEE512